MKRTLLTALEVDSLLSALPQELRSSVQGAALYNSSCSPEARVYLVDRDGGYYLKTNARGTLRLEAEMTSYFHGKGLGTEVLRYSSQERDWLLTRRVAGEDCTHAQYLDDPRRLTVLIAERLRMLHETDCRDCPVQDRMGAYRALAEENYQTGNYDKSAFPDSFGYRSAEEAHAVLQAGGHLLRNEVLLHGDYCLPNVMLNDWQFSGLIDLGNGGVGDRHIDLFWGVWSLGFNLKTDRFGGRFLDAYGRDKVEPELLRIVAAYEIFG